MENSKIVVKKAAICFFPDLPILIWMILITLFIGIFAGFDAKQIISTFNSGWGYAAGEFALILLPSFILAAAIRKQQIIIPEAVSVSLAPVVSAGMICPDTAYAALSPMVRKHQISLAFGAYAGFKLLFPAGPLVIATSLGVTDSVIWLYSLGVFVPVWIVGLVYARIIETNFVSNALDSAPLASSNVLATLSPFVLLVILLAVGAGFDLSRNSLADFFTNPKGALLVSAAIALLMVPHHQRRACVDSGVRWTGSLLLIIGAASAFSAFVTVVIPIEDIFGPQSGILTLGSLFAMTAVFKLLQGSSMSTFAAAGPVAVPIVAASNLSPILAVLAVCLGSFVAILPNDSFYWLIRRSALAEESELRAMMILGVGSVLQAFIGLALVFGIHTFFMS